MQENRRQKKQTGKNCCPSCTPVRDLFSHRFFKALGDPTRVAILVDMTERSDPATVSELACGIPVDLSVVSRHLATLREAGIVSAERRGREVFYSIRYPEMTRALREMADAIEACCPVERSARDRNESESRSPF